MAFWDNEFTTYPDNTWFYACDESGYIPGWWSYWYKIPPDNHHYRQIAMKPAVDYPAKGWKKGVIYIIVRAGDTPNWAGASLIAIAPPCSNWGAYLYEATAQTRDQSWGLNAAIRANRDKAVGLKALVALTDALPCSIKAALAGNPELEADISAYIQGNPERAHKLKAAIQEGQELPLGLVCAVAAPFDLPTGISATIQGNPWEHCHLKAAIKGETETSVGIVAYVVKSRLDTILLEMENLWPQELDLRSTPNWRSRVKDWRTATLGE